jgi:hypothetical protein
MDQKLNDEHQKKLKDFLNKELSTKDTLSKEIKSLEENQRNLNDTRNDLFKQLNEKEKVIDTKTDEKNLLKSKLNIKQT